MLYTDGAARGNPGPGGYGVLLIWNGHRKELSQGYKHTTNNRMELIAAVRALETLKEPCEVTLTTDSQYLRKAFTDGWLKNWQRNGWRTASKDPVKNKDLWLILLDLTKQHEINWKWTLGHAGHTENEQVDEMALRARKKL